MKILSRLGGRSANRGAQGSILERVGFVQWFSGRDRREQFLMAIGGAVVLGYLAIVVVWQPLSAMRANALADIAKYEAITARIAAADPTLASATGSAPNMPVATLITDSATAVGLIIRRLEPEGERTRIELEEADFSVLIDWLALLDNNHSLRVTTIELDRKPSPGVVSARISVAY